jgi:hypothetical protein
LSEFLYADEEALLHALWVLSENVFQDRDIEDAMRVLLDDHRPALRKAAQLTLSMFL